MPDYKQIALTDISGEVFPYPGQAANLKFRPTIATSDHDIVTSEIGSTGIYVAADGSYRDGTNLKKLIVIASNKLPNLKYQAIFYNAGIDLYFDMRLGPEEYIDKGRATLLAIPNEANGNCYLCGESGTYTNFKDIDNVAITAAHGDGLLCVDLGGGSPQFCWILLPGYGKASLTI